MTRTTKPKRSPITWRGPDALRRLLVPIAQPKHDEKNPRKHDPRNRDAIRGSLEAFGQLKPLVVRKQTGVVVAGNGTLGVMRELGWSHVAVLTVPLTDAQARAYAIADNRTAELGTWDFAELSEALADPELEQLTEAMGFSAGEIDDLIAQAGEAAADDDAGDGPSSRKVAFTAKEGGEADPADDDFEPPTEPRTKPGDVWQLGEHEILCADALGVDAAKWIGSGRFAAVVTDPPYAIYGSSTGVGRDVADDRMVRPFFAGVAKLVRAALRVHGHAYVCTDWRSWSSFWEAARSADLAIVNQLIWDKSSGLGSNYANVAELVAFCHRLPSRTMQKGREKGVRTVLKPNVFRIARPTGDERQHNAAKPVKLLQEWIGNSTDAGELVLDPFAGSGSTLIACEREGRKCRAVEVEPKWVDVVVARWERTTGETATRRKSKP